MLDLTSHSTTRRADTIPSPAPERAARAGLRSRRAHPVATWLPVRGDDGRVRMEMVWTMSHVGDPDAAG